MFAHVPFIFSLRTQDSAPSLSYQPTFKTTSYENSMLSKSIFLEFFVFSFLSKHLEVFTSFIRYSMLDTPLILIINPFAAPACKISGLKDAWTCLKNSTFFWSYHTSTFNAMRFDDNPFTHQYKKEKKKA